MDYKKLERKIGYKFWNKEIFKRALTHSSYAHENKIKDNERIEFLGDAVIELAVSNYIFKKYEELNEGDLTKLRASLVCESALAAMARKVSLGKFIFLGKGELNNKGNERDSILSDTFEALIGAVYLDSTYKKAERVMINILKSYMETFEVNYLYTDYKTFLQEYLQKAGTCTIAYELIKEEGPDHDKKFYIEVKRNGETLGQGIGKSKKEAEQNAAKDAMEKMK